MVLATWNCFAVPVTVAFEPAFLEHVGMFIFNSCIDIIFLIDIFVNFRTSYMDQKTGAEIVKAHLIGWRYFKFQLWIDIFATVPIDTFVGFFGAVNSTLQAFGILKLIRVLRLSRIISYLRVVETVKASMRLVKLVFFLILYVHCLGCAWFWVVKQNETWMPPLDYVWVRTDFYIEDKFFQYCSSVYHAILMLTGNDLGPRGSI